MPQRSRRAGVVRAVAAGLAALLLCAGSAAQGSVGGRSGSAAGQAAAAHGGTHAGAAAEAGNVHAGACRVEYSVIGPGQGGFGSGGPRKGGSGQGGAGQGGQGGPGASNSGSARQGEFRAQAVVTNEGPALASWTLGFQYAAGQQEVSAFGGSVGQHGGQVAVGGTGALPAGSTIAVDLVVAGSAASPAPGYFTLNGTACDGAPQLPQVNLTAPEQNAVVTPGTDVTLTASAVETAGSARVTAVDFFDGSALLGTSTTSPYSFSWHGAAKGFTRLSAKAVDSAGQSAVSPPVELTVLPGGTAPQLHVSGNELVDAAGHTVQLRGVDRSGGEFSCTGGSGIWDGPMDAASVRAIRAWGVNAVRIPLNEACWLGEPYVNPSVAGIAYQSAVKSYVALLHEYGIVAILDLHWTDGAYRASGAPCASAAAVCQKPMPDAPNAVDFWTQVATAFKGDDATIFDLFNEPFPQAAPGASLAEAWHCWLSGGTCTGIGYQVAGMQSLVNAVRAAGAHNVVMLGGLSDANNLGEWLSHEPKDPDHNLAASWHSYGPSDCGPACWSGQLSAALAQVPVIAGEIGEMDCGTGYVSPLMDWLDQRGAGYLAWTWNSWDCGSGPALVTDYLGDPTPYGAAVRSHLRELAVESGG